MDALQQSFRIASSGLQAQSTRLRVASENLANAESTGKTPGSAPYARKTISFDSALDEATGSDLVTVSEIGRDNSPFRVERHPGHPAADASGNVKLPNVNLLVEMADIREASRTYDANIQVIRQARELTSMTIDLLRTT